MTRNYFLDYVTEWGELIELCREYDCYICEDIINEDELDDYVGSDICNTDYGWRSIRDFLSGIPTGYDYYRSDGTFDYVGLDNSDFEDYKNRVLDWMDEYGIWDAEEENEDEDNFDTSEGDFFSTGPESEYEPSDPPVIDEDFSVSELMRMCSAELVTICRVMTQRSISDDDMLPAIPF